MCCDPINGNDYSVNFRLNGSLAERAGVTEYTRIEVDVTTNGNVKEDEIERKTMFVADKTQTNVTQNNKQRQDE